LRKIGEEGGKKRRPKAGFTKEKRSTIWQQTRILEEAAKNRPGPRSGKRHVTKMTPPAERGHRHRAKRLRKQKKKVRRPECGETYSTAYGEEEAGGSYPWRRLKAKTPFANNKKQNRPKRAHPPSGPEGRKATHKKGLTAKPKKNPSGLSPGERDQKKRAAKEKRDYVFNTFLKGGPSLRKISSRKGSTTSFALAGEKKNPLSG